MPALEWLLAAVQALVDDDVALLREPRKLAPEQMSQLHVVLTAPMLTLLLL